MTTQDAKHPTSPRTMTQEDRERARTVCPCWGDPDTGPESCGIGDVTCELHDSIAKALATVRAEEREAIVDMVARITVAMNPEQVQERRDLIAAIRGREGK